MTWRISTPAPSASTQWVTSACQRSFGWSAANRTNELRGRFAGSGVTNPRRVSTRQMVETAGAVPCRRARCTAIVAAPASRHAPARLLRSSTISFSTSTVVRDGLEPGRRERGSSPASPSAWKRARSFCTRRRDTRYSRATSLLVRPSRSTPATTNRASDIVHSPHQGERCLATPVHYVLNSDTAVPTNEGAGQFAGSWQNTDRIGHRPRLSRTRTLISIGVPANPKSSRRRRSRKRR